MTDPTALPELICTCGLCNDPTQITCSQVMAKTAARALPEDQPVAWRWRNKGVQSWRYVEREPTSATSMFPVDIEPLYTRPALPVGGERQALKEAEADVRFVLRLLNNDQPSNALDAARIAHDKICNALVILPAASPPPASADTGLVKANLTKEEIYLLDWLAKEDGQYGECHGKTLDGLLAKKLAVVQGIESGINNGFIAKGTDIMYRAVSITGAGRAALSRARKALAEQTALPIG